MTWSRPKGSIPALVTPMDADGAIDYAALDRLIDWHVGEGSDGLVIVGTTGESPTVAFDEHCALIAATVRRAGGRLPVIAGTGANSTTEAIELARHAKAVGADAHLSVVPYYNKPNQEGLYRHFRAIAEAVDLPMIVYNVPGRTVADLANDTAIRLAQVEGIVGIKDATGDIARGTDLLRRLPSNFAVYSGDDATALALTLLGGDGVISVTANAAPGPMHRMIRAAQEGRLAEARAMNFRLIDLHRNLFIEPNPVPLKWVMSRLELIENSLRLPLVPLSADGESILIDAMRLAGIYTEHPPKSERDRHE